MYTQEQCFHLIDRKTAKTVGLRYYFTGNLCKNGIRWERYTQNGACYCPSCCEYRSIRVKDRHLKNPAIRNNIERKTYYKNREKNIKKMAAWKAKNADILKEKQREYRKENAEKIKAAAAKRYKENIDRVRAYRQDNSVRYAMHCADRRLKMDARRLGTTNADLLQFYEEARRLTDSTGVRHHVDHIVPINGVDVSGMHVPWNLQVIPAADNFRKGNRDYPYIETF